MAQALALLFTLEASGLSRDDALGTLLDGGMGRAFTLAEILGEVQDPREALDLARAAALRVDDLQSACKALVDQGIHPLSLLLGGDERFRRWLSSDDGGWRFHLRGLPFHSECRWGQVTLRNFLPTPWLRNLPPGLRVVAAPEVESLVVSDADLTDLFGPDLDLDLHLRLQACDGSIQVPGRVRGRLQLRFSDAQFLFPSRQDLDGILEIVGCPGVQALPGSLRTSGLYLQYCKGLDTLPDHLEGACQIDLTHLPISRFPAGVEDLAYLRLAALPNLRNLALPSGPRLDANLVALPALTRLQAPTSGTLRNLLIAHCDHLQALPKGLKHIQGDLTLNGLPRLTGLPEGLRVDGSLVVSACPRLRGLPSGLSVGLELNLEEAPHLAHGPSQTL